MMTILKDLHEEDFFAIIQFDDQINPWKKTLVKANKDNVAEAVAYTQRIDSRGG